MVSQPQPGLDPWLLEFEEAMRLTDDIAFRLQEVEELTRRGEDASRPIASARKRVRRLSATADKLQEVLDKGQEGDALPEKELYRRRDMVMGIRYRAKSQGGQLPAPSADAPGSSSPLTPQPTRWSRRPALEEEGSTAAQATLRENPEVPGAARDGDADVGSKDKHVVVEVKDAPSTLEQPLLEHSGEQPEESVGPPKPAASQAAWLKQEAANRCSCTLMTLVLLALLILVFVALDMGVWIVA